MQKVVKRTSCFILFVVFCLSGCAHWKSGYDRVELQEDDLRINTYPPSAQDSDPVYLLLSAELAGQRGQYKEALNQYMELAHRNPDVQIAERATQIALYLKNTETALEAAKLWLEYDPDSLEAHRVLAMLLFKAGQIEKAIEQCKAFLLPNDAGLENTLIELVKWISTELTKENALTVMDQMAKAFPNMAEFHFAYALLASEKNEPQLALTHVERALTFHPEWGRARLLQAQVMSKMGHSQEARYIIQRALKQDPGNNRLRLIYSQLLVQSGDWKEAERELQFILKKEPTNDDIRFMLASVWTEAGNYTKATPLLLHLSEVPKWQSQACFYLGLIEARQGQLAHSVSWFDRVTSGTLEFEARVNAITALIGLGQPEPARDRLVRTRQSFPNEALRLYLLEAELLVKYKQHEAAFHVLTEALKEIPGPPSEILYSRALIAEQLNRMDTVESDLQAVLQKKPDDPNALNALGYTLASRTQRLEEAKGYIERALKIKPDDPAIMDSYGWVLYRQGNYKEALHYLYKAYRLFPDPEIGAHLGEVLWESGQHIEAQKIWKESMKKDPHHREIERVQLQYKEAFD